MSQKAYGRPKKRVGEIFRFLHTLISLGHKLKEHPSEKLDNFVLVALMLRDSVMCRSIICKTLATQIQHPLDISFLYIIQSYESWTVKDHLCKVTGCFGNLILPDGYLKVRNQKCLHIVDVFYARRYVLHTNLTLHNH